MSVFWATLYRHIQCYERATGSLPCEVRIRKVPRSVAPNEFESGKWGVRRKSAEKILVVPLDFFGSKITISRFGERFRGGQYSLVSFLCAVLLTVPPCPAICKSGGTCPPPVPYGVGATGFDHRPRNIQIAIYRSVASVAGVMDRTEL